MDLKVNNISFGGRINNILVLPRELRQTYKTFRNECQNIDAADYIRGAIKLSAYLFELPNRLSETFKNCIKNKN